jgi:hypothetical protein
MRWTFILCIIASLSISISNASPIPCLDGLRRGLIGGHSNGYGNSSKINGSLDSHLN